MSPVADNREALDDLRRGRLALSPHYFRVDMPFYRERLEEFLPRRIVDIHCHVSRSRREPTNWAGRVIGGRGFRMEEMLELQLKMFPGKEVLPVVFGHPIPGRADEENAYLAEELGVHGHVRGLLLTDPSWGPDELEERASKGDFRGLKPYLTMVHGRPRAGTGSAHEEVRILDFLPPEHLKIAERRGLLVMLHVPRARRIADEENIRQLLWIAEHFPELKVVLAHVGRAYCPGSCQEGVRRIAESTGFNFDVSANSCREVFETLIEAAGPGRILYGSDLPITAMRARRICEGEEYVNLVRGADWEDERTRRDPEHEDEFTFFLYEEIDAFRRAARSSGLARKDIEDVFCANALRLLGEEESIGQGT